MVALGKVQPPAGDGGFAFATGIKNIAFVDWPGGEEGEQYAIRPLARADIYTSAADAETYLADIGIEPDGIATRDENGAPVTYRDLAIRDEHLLRTMRRASAPEHQLFDSAEDLRSKLSPLEIDKFYLRVAAHMQKAAPLTKAEMLADQGAFDQLFELVKKNQDPESLSVLSAPILRRFVTYMANRLSS